jgi:hypothetical protein
MTGQVAAGRPWMTSRAAGLAGLGAVVNLLLIAAAAPLAIMARQNPLSNAGSSIALAVPCATVGFVVARRKPRNPLGWFMMAVGVGLVLSNDAGLYAIADYRLRHGDLPLGWVAVLLQPLWAPSFVAYPLVILLFPDGRLPSRRWRWVLWSYLVVGAYLPVGIYEITIRTVIGHRIQVLANGDLAAVDNPSGGGGVLSALVGAALPLLVVFWLAFLGRQVGSFRRSSGERRQQLKWLMTGAAIFVISLILSVVVSIIDSHPSAFVRVLISIGALGILALPVGIGVGILKYRLYEIDRLISRTLAYAVVTGLLVGVYVGLVLLATRVLSFSSPVAVAASTLAAAALFNPVRRRVQRVVDRRFNRARYDAEVTVAAFSARLKDAVDLGAVRADLLDVVNRSLEPSHVSVWVREHE